MLATLTAAFLRLFVWHKALGKPTHELARTGEFTAEELDELAWRFPKKYDRCSARAMRLVRHERAARCSAKVEEMFMTAPAKDLPHLARALEILARIQLLKAPATKPAKRRAAPAPDETNWVEIVTEEPTDAANNVVDDAEKVTREDYELAVFHIELQKQLQHKPELYQAVIDEVLKQDAQHAHETLPPLEAKPEPTKPAKQNLLTGLLWFVASWFGLAQHTPIPPFS
jgi:hypothetical protein